METGKIKFTPNNDELVRVLKELVGEIKLCREMDERGRLRRFPLPRPVAPKPDEKYGPPGVWAAIKSHFGSERAARAAEDSGTGTVKVRFGVEDIKEITASIKADLQRDNAKQIHALAEKFGYAQGLVEATDEELTAALESQEFILGLISGVMHQKWQQKHPGKGPEVNPFRLHRQE